MTKYLLAIGFLFLVACTDPKNAQRILENDGYTDIKFTGYGLFSCSKNDFYHTEFSAKKGNKEIEGVVCSGLIFKASTIRLY